MTTQPTPNVTVETRFVRYSLGPEEKEAEKRDYDKLDEFAQIYDVTVTRFNFTGRETILTIAGYDLFNVGIVTGAALMLHYVPFTSIEQTKEG